MDYVTKTLVWGLVVDLDVNPTLPVLEFEVAVHDPPLVHVIHRRENLFRRRQESVSMSDLNRWEILPHTLSGAAQWVAPRVLPRDTYPESYRV